MVIFAGPYKFPPSFKKFLNDLQRNFQWLIKTKPWEFPTSFFSAETQNDRGNFNVILRLTHFKENANAVANDKFNNKKIQNYNDTLSRYKINAIVTFKQGQNDYRYLCDTCKNVH